MNYLNTQVTRALREAEKGNMKEFIVHAPAIIEDLPINSSVTLFMRDIGDYFFVYEDNNDASEGFHSMQLFEDGYLRLVDSFDNFKEAAQRCLQVVFTDKDI